MPEIIMKDGPLKDQKFEIGETPIVLGREPGCDIQVLDKGASRKHAEFFKIGAMCFIRDFKSRNGTLLNGESVEEEMLRDGDIIKIGSTTLLFQSVSNKDAAKVEFFDEESTSASLELDLEDLTDLTASQGDGTDIQRLRGLYKLGRIIEETSNEKELLKKALAHITEQFNSEMTYIFTHSNDSEGLTTLGLHTRKGNEAKRISRTIIDRAIKDKMAILTTDATRDGRFNSQESIMTNNIRSVVCVPLSISGGIKGVLYLASNSPTVTFVEEDLELAAAMADQVGLALTNFQYLVHLRENLMSTLSVLITNIESRVPLIKGRSRTVADYALGIAENLGLDQHTQQNIFLAGLLHNIGILNEENEELFCSDLISLPAAERTELEEARIKADLNVIASMKCYDNIENTIRFMYERGDMSGPSKLERYEIPESAKILGLAIEFEESIRIRGAANRKFIIQEMENKIDILYDKRLIRGLIALKNF